MFLLYIKVQVIVGNVLICMESEKMSKIIYVVLCLLCVGSVFGFADEDTLIPQLVFHDTVNSVNENTTSWELSVSNTDIVLKTLKDLGYCSITFEDFLAFKEGTKQLCDRPVILVFDDGRKSTYTLALPILQKYGFVGVTAVITGKVGTSQAFMDWTEINLLKSYGWGITSHSVNHLSFNSLNNNSAEMEYIDSQLAIFGNTGYVAKAFVYPFYAWNNATLVRCLGHYSGCATTTGLGYMQKNIPLSKGFYRTTLDGLQKKSNVVESFVNMLPYKTAINNNPVSGNIVRNPGFDGKTGWTFYTKGVGVASFNNVSQISITKVNGNTQLYQTSVPLKPNTKYKLVFDAMAEKSSRLQVSLLKHTNPYTIYGLNMFNANLSNNWKTFETIFYTPFSASSDARLMFWLVNGVVGEKYFLDNVVLEEYPMVNLPPVTVSARVAESLQAGQDLLGYCTATDDNYPIKHNYRWYLDDVLYSSGESYCAYTNCAVGEHIASQIDGGQVLEGQRWVFSCQANDFVQNGSWLNSSELIISAPFTQGTPSIIDTRITVGTGDFVIIPGMIMYPETILTGYYNITDPDINQYGQPDSFNLDCYWYADGVLNSTEEVSHYSVVIGSEQQLDIKVNAKAGTNWELVCDIPEYEGQPLPLLNHFSIDVSNSNICNIADRICEPQSYHSMSYNLYECSNNRNHYDFIERCDNGCGNGECIGGD